jgi:hypothetical protein
MSLPAATQRMTRPLLLIAAIVVVLAFALWGRERGVAALLGSTLSVANWFALRWLAGRLAERSDGQSAGLSLLLIAKIGALMAIVYLLIHRVGVDAVGLAFGLGVLFVGPVLAGLLAGNGPAKESAMNSNVRSAREER